MRRLNTIFISFAVVLLASTKVVAQPSYGTTGLLNMPTAEMEESATFKVGANYLERHSSVSRWFYDTFNYYVNLTLFPWFEITYNMTLHKAVPNDRGLTTFWIPRTYGRFVNQDRQFGIRVRLLEEGTWNKWMPQVVFGWDDVSSNSWGDVDRRFEIADNAANNFNFRMYLVATKRFSFSGVGDLGAHLAYVYNNRSDYPLNAPSFGADYRFAFSDVDVFWKKAINGLDLMIEAYPAGGFGYSWTDDGKYMGAMDRGVHLGIYDINLGFKYYLWRDKIGLFGEFYGCKDFSGGIQYKVNLF